MILQPNTVELTKVHYFSNEIQIRTISREISDNRLNGEAIIRKGPFRHKWVLKINEIGGSSGRKCQWRLVSSLVVLACLLAGVAFAVCLDWFRTVKRVEIGTVFTFVEKSGRNSTVGPAVTVATIRKQYCQNCTSICLKMSETETPQCVQPSDEKDPTGCGGLCKINTQFCQLLDNHNRVYQCSNLKNVLKCPQGMYNCGNMCINPSKRCDGIVHCSNKADEENCDCDLERNFRCANMTSCIPKSKKCDGFVDCWDKSDEIDCSKGCQNGTIPCLNGDCIRKDEFCDGKSHCSDGSDEPQGCQL